MQAMTTLRLAAAMALAGATALTTMTPAFAADEPRRPE